MPLTQDEKTALYTAAVQDELDRAKVYIEKLMAVRPPTGGLEGRDYVMALGALWYSMLGGLRKVRGEAEAIQTDIEANMIAGIMAPDLVSLKDAVQRALDYSKMANPDVKA